MLAVLRVWRQSAEALEPSSGWRHEEVELDRDRTDRYVLVVQLRIIVWVCLCWEPDSDRFSGTPCRRWWGGQQEERGCMNPDT